MSTEPAADPFELYMRRAPMSYSDAQLVGRGNRDTSHERRRGTATALAAALAGSEVTRENVMVREVGRSYVCIGDAAPVACKNVVQLQVAACRLIKANKTAGI